VLVSVTAILLRAHVGHRLVHVGSAWHRRSQGWTASCLVWGVGEWSALVLERRSHRVTTHRTTALPLVSVVLVVRRRVPHLLWIVLRVKVTSATTTSISTTRSRARTLIIHVVVVGLGLAALVAGLCVALRGTLGSRCLSHVTL
jgi:hypothetical protein